MPVVMLDEDEALGPKIHNNLYERNITHTVEYVACNAAFIVRFGSIGSTSR